MARVADVIRGISEVGAVRAALDVSFGKTAPNGVTISFQPSQLDVESGQGTFLADTFVTSSKVEVTVRLIFANLKNVAEVLGLNFANLTGNLDAEPKVGEKLVIPADGIGRRTDALYVITPGPFGPRRYDFARCKVKGSVTLELGRDNFVTLEGTWAVLDAGAGVNPIEIEDAP